MDAPHTEESPPSPHQPDLDARSHLTGRELVILQLLARGYSLGQCAQLTGASGTETLAAAQNAARKLDVPDIALAVFEAHRRGLIV